MKDEPIERSRTKSIKFAKKHLMQREISKEIVDRTLLVEVAWEVCNQVGGIYTVIRSKVPAMTNVWGGNYLLVGPYVHDKIAAVFDPIEDFSGPVGAAVLAMREKGFQVNYGHWLVSGRPKVVLFNPYDVWGKLAEIKAALWRDHKIPSNDGDNLLDQVVALGHQITEFFRILSNPEINGGLKILGHFHEWMAGTPIPNIRKENLEVSTVFTTHATLLGRYLAMNDPVFYEYLGFYNWEHEAKHFNIEPAAKIERAAAHGSHVFSTVSQVTAKECEHLLGRKPDVILPNGLNIERFEALHEFQNLHFEYKKKINQFVLGHFFQSYSFDLDNTLYFFTSGRYEYRNKGYDLTIEALARLNWRMKESNIDKTVVTFFITKRPFNSINPQVLQSRAVMEEIRQTCADIEKQVGNKLFQAAAGSSDHRLPDLNSFVDDYMRLRLRRTLQSWKSPNLLPAIITHNLLDDQNDELLNFLRAANLINKREDKVKVVYHPDFISPTNPLFGMEYGQFVRGCHLGVFPSYYEPWGYTPLECIASGVPAVTSDLSGFGDYVLQTLRDHNEHGMYVVDRRHGSFDRSANQLADFLFEFVKLDRRERINFRNKVESSSILFGWRHLACYYDQAYNLALERS